MKIALMIILAIVAILLIVSVILQQSDSNGLSALTGNTDSTFGRKKANGYDDKLAKITVIMAIAFIIVNLILVIIA